MTFQLNERITLEFVFAHCETYGSPCSRRNHPLPQKQCEVPWSLRQRLLLACQLAGQ